MFLPVTAPLTTKDYSRVHELYFFPFSHFCLNEVICTSQGDKYRYSNFVHFLKPDVFYNSLLVLHILQYLRDFVVCGPIYISSFVRSPETNAVVGGVSNSDHLKGCAVDIRTNEMPDGMVRNVLSRLNKFRDFGLVRFVQYNSDKSYIHISIYDTSAH